MVLNFCLIVLRAEKRHPCLRLFDWRRTNLWLSNGLSLACSSVTLSSPFSDAVKIYVPMPHTIVCGGAPLDPGRTEHWYTHFKSMYCCVSCQCVTKLLIMLSSNQKASPLPSTVWSAEVNSW
jgi:hypothetical protein